jgi:hypothetical protein
MTQIEEKTGVSQFWSGLVKVKRLFIGFVKELLCLVAKPDSRKIYGMMGKPCQGLFLDCLIFL